MKKATQKSGALQNYFDVLEGGFNNRSRNAQDKENRNSSRVVQGRPSHAQDDGEGESWRDQDREEVEAYARRDNRDGREA
jgi:hypothetical protein